MATLSNVGTARRGETIAALAAADGTAGAAWPHRLGDSGIALRDIADAVHSLCALHGGMPGIVDHAREATQADAAQAWLDDAVAAFAVERALLATLIAAVGPLPSTPGAAASEAALLTQRHALALLASSDRTGCAIGAAGAFVIDWHPIRRLLDNAAIRVGVTPPEWGFADIAATTAMLDRVAVTPATERAIGFGAQQMLAQHRGLWQLLEARSSARRSL